MPLYDNILKTIGHTPVVRLNRLSPAGRTIYAKVESFNPFASVKDRLAIGIIEDAERRGLLRPGQVVCEATSGNTGISLAAVCAVKGHPFVAVMGEQFSVERRKLMQFYGAKVVLTPSELRGTGMVQKAEELAQRFGWFLPRQFDNEANPTYHRQTTGPEVLADFVGERLDCFVLGWGTGGTITGAGSVIKLARPDVKVVAVEPQKGALLSGQDWSPHKIQGWSPDFLPDILHRHRDDIDEVLTVTDEEAIETARLLAREEGIATGISGGGSVAGAVKCAKAAADGAAVVCVVADTAERYLSTVLFEGMEEGIVQDEEELANL
ncbi:unnamed protein product [Vitrella brassicaformis CCMP3155]|uniref:Tryptophan synthase beta chain-like PALP domain-containing protein n=1 Tax=Vitrella brassicaformis (strain CCMP3155) TaxID=1169540 RepID=A0A0G4ETG0_VITBC|nr:unnamed protein product [Vitrella brassicaformis CCMP3155]|mmetsp:Transcript_10703/g.25951  ORF Transcript_10703/g.25951 Transcript_10703/m.25951 type:complete len:323 (+) Transcript_10703:122-1090(+)|eukprot:CEM00944.1 unnamed protein product [Vitrella brassicaformis CCMP3155]